MLSTVFGFLDSDSFPVETSTVCHYSLASLMASLMKGLSCCFCFASTDAYVTQMVSWFRHLGHQKANCTKMLKWLTAGSGEHAVLPMRRGQTIRVGKSILWFWWQQAI